MEVGKFYTVKLEDYGSVMVDYQNKVIKFKIKPMLKDENTGEIIEKAAIVKPYLKYGKPELDVVRRVTDPADTNPGK